MSTGIKAAFRQHDYPLPIVRGPFDGQMNGRHKKTAFPYLVQPHAFRFNCIVGFLTLSLPLIRHELTQIYF
jgi:hypothetical protein